MQINRLTCKVQNSWGVCLILNFSELLQDFKSEIKCGFYFVGCATDLQQNILDLEAKNSVEK